MFQEKVELEFKYTELKSRYDKIHSEHKDELAGLEQGYISSRREMGHTEQEYQARLGELTAKLQSLGNITLFLINLTTGYSNKHGN